MPRQDSSLSALYYLRFALFLLVPLAVSGYLGFFAIDLEETFRSQKARRQLERDLDEWIQRIEPVGTVRQRFHQFADQLDEDLVSDRRVWWLYNLARRQWGIDFEPFVFDAEGKLLTSRDFGLRNRPMFQKMWDAFSGSEKALETADRFRKPFQALLGYEFRLRNIVGMPGVLHPIRSQQRDGFLFWKKLKKSGASGVILVGWERPTPLKLLMLSLERSSFHRFAMIMEDDAGKRHTLGRSFSGNQNDILKQAEVYGHSWFLSQGWQWAASQIGENRLLIGLPAPDLNLNHLRRRLWVGLALGLVIGFWLFHGWFFRGRDLYLSIKTKTLLFFALAVFAPLMGIMFLSFQTVHLRRQILEDQIERDAREKLLALDSAFSGSIEEFQWFCREIRDRWIRDGNRESMQIEYRNLLSQGKIVHAEARDLNGEMLLKQTGNRCFEGMESTMTSIAKMCIERNLTEKRKSLNLPADLIDDSTREVLQNRETGFPGLLSPGEAQSIRFGKNEFLYFWDTVDVPGKDLSYLVLIQSLSGHIPGFIQNLLRRNPNAKNRDFQIFARSESTGRWFPGEEKMGGRLEQFMERLRISGRMLCDQVFRHGQRFYAVGMPGKNFSGIGLLALVPGKSVEDELQEWHFRILAGIAGTLLMSLIIGRFLGAAFLAPMKELGAGLHALREQCPEFRVQIQTGDELEELGGAFNQMLSDLNEMELARVVQSALIPWKIPVVRGYDISLESEIAHNLGGDYCDVLPMKDGRILFVIGDVSGHGVSSALLMAMAKAVAFEFSNQGGEASELLFQMNQLVHRLMGRRKLMTYFAGVLEPDTGRFAFSNAGHPFPLMVLADGKIGELAMIHLPLGLPAQKGSFKNQETHLPPGALLLLYTDGLIEMMNSSSEQFGYERLSETLATFKGRSAYTALEELKRLYRGFHGTGRLEDDVTIMVLGRTEVLQVGCTP